MSSMPHSSSHTARAARITVAMVVGLLAGLWVANMGRVVLAATQAPIHVANASHLVVLGKRLSSGAIDADFRSRLDRARAMMAADPRSLLVISGGGQGTSEAAAGLRELQGNIKQALDPTRIILEERSSSTQENLQNIRKLLPENTRPIVISSRYHMARISRLAAQANMPVHVVAAEPALSLGLASTSHMIKEAVYLTALDLAVIM